MSREEEIRRHYQPRIAPHRDSHDVLDWASETSQFVRFDVLLREVQLQGRSILDVGCGLGDLWGYLQRREVYADYTGVDILPEMVAEATRRHPGAQFACENVFADPAPEHLRRDVVFCSGMFNLNLGNNLQFVPGALRRFVQLADTHVVFNMLHHRTPEQPPRYFYYDPDRVLEILDALPCRARLVDDYLPNDFTVVCEITR
ncbi:MAG: class I SAM-dependent methyltransferase [Phycisphaerae bacterium]